MTRTPYFWTAAEIEALRVKWAVEKVEIRKNGPDPLPGRSAQSCLAKVADMREKTGDPDWEKRDSNRRDWTDEEYNEIEAMYRRGVPAPRIAAEFGPNVTRAAINSIAYRNGWKHGDLANQDMPQAEDPQPYRRRKNTLPPPFMPPKRIKGCVWPSIIEGGGVKYCGRGKQGHAHWCEYHRGIALQPAREMEEV